jgi:hypothetical protein
MNTLALLSLICLTAFAQESPITPRPDVSRETVFGFKGDNLGETLAEFKTRNSRDADFGPGGAIPPPDLGPHRVGKTFAEWLKFNNLDLDDICQKRRRVDNHMDFKTVCKSLSAIRDTGRGEFYTTTNTGRTFKSVFEDGKVRQYSRSGVLHVHYPICSGDKINETEYGLDITPFEIHSDSSRYVFCIVALEGKEPIPTIAGVEPWNLIYRFSDGILFEISTFVGREDFSTVEQGFKEKYGNPLLSKAQHFQNGYGARFEGTADVWTNKDSMIELHELSTERTPPVSKVDIHDTQRFNEYYKIKTIAHPGKDI